MTDLLATFWAIALWLLGMMVTRKAFIFSTDCYSECFVKVQERIRRAISQKCLVSGPATKKPTDFMLFLRNIENKQQLFNRILSPPRGGARGGGGEGGRRGYGGVREGDRTSNDFLTIFLNRLEPQSFLARGRGKGDFRCFFFCYFKPLNCSLWFLW